MISNKTVILQLILLVAITFGGCKDQKSVETKKELPRLGRYEVVKKETGDGPVADTLWHQIADFKFVNQDSSWVTEETFAGDIYVADFFFTTCPDICPIMKTQMLRIYDAYQNNPNVKFLSHTIDPRNDSVAVLKDYAERLGVTSNRWHFVTGNKDDIYRHGQTSYLATMADGGSEGFSHSGRFFLIDENRHIRGAYDGTSTEEVDLLIEDLQLLLQDQKN